MAEQPGGCAPQTFLATLHEFESACGSRIGIKKVDLFFTRTPLIFSIKAPLSSFPTSLTTIWSATEFGIASRILFYTCLSEILQASCHRLKRATHAAHCIWLHSSSSAGIAALLFYPPPLSLLPDAGCTARRWLVIACRISFTSTRALFTLNVQSFLSQSLMAAKSAGSGTGGGISKLSLPGPD